MQVPVIERQVKEEIPTIPTPQISGPVRGAFKEDVAQSLEKLGQVGMQFGTTLLEHMQKQAYFKAEARGKEAANQFALAQSDLLNSTEPKDIQDEKGNIRTTITGLLNRKNFYAHDALFEYKQQMEALANEYAEQFKDDPVALNIFKELVDTSYKTGYQTVNEHEAREWRNGQNNIYVSTAANLINQAEIAQTPELLSGVLGNLIKNNDSMASFDGWDAETAQKHKDDSVLKAIKRATLGRLNATGSVDEAHNLLDAIKDKLPQPTYDEIKQDIEKVAVQNAEKIRRIQAENTRLTKFAIDKAEDDLVVKKINNQLTEADVREALSQGAIRPKFADSLIKALISLNTVDVKTDPATYGDMVDLVLSPNRKAGEVREKLLDAYNEGLLSETDFKHLYTTKMIPSQAGRGYSVAEEYSDEMAKANEPPRLGFIRTAVEMLKTFGQVANVANPLIITVPLIKQLFNRIEAGKTPDNGIQEIAKELVKEKIKSDNPVVGFLDDVPNIIATKGAIKTAYPGSTKLKTESTYKGELDTQEKYEVGDTVTHNGVEYIVVDFDTDGEPLLEEAENAR